MTAGEAKILANGHLKPEMVDPFFVMICEDIHIAAKRGYYSILNLEDIFTKPHGLRPSHEQWVVLCGMLKANGFVVSHSSPSNLFPTQNTAVLWR